MEHFLKLKTVKAYSVQNQMLICHIFKCMVKRLPKNLQVYGQHYSNPFCGDCDDQGYPVAYLFKMQENYYQLKPL